MAFYRIVGTFRLAPTDDPDEAQIVKNILNSIHRYVKSVDPAARFGSHKAEVNKFLLRIENVDLDECKFRQALEIEERLQQLKPYLSEAATFTARVEDRMETIVIGNEEQIAVANRNRRERQARHLVKLMDAGELQWLATYASNERLRRATEGR